jgi:4'-phosphopantetheinyl transferase
VWWATLSATDEELDRLAPLLSPDERLRAARYIIPEVKRRFIVGRATLRTLLGRYLGVQASDIDLEYGRAGKPRLRDRFGSDLTFNLAHSHQRAAFAFCRKTEIGIDIEYVDRSIDTTAIVSTMFSSSERERYRALPEGEQRLAFYVAWTRKEAYLKGDGCGFTGPLAEVDVVTGVNGPRRFAVAGRGGAGGWSVEDLTFDEGWVGAVAVQRSEWQLKIGRWPRLDGHGDGNRREISAPEGGRHGMQEMWLCHQPGTNVVPRVQCVGAVGRAA